MTLFSNKPKTEPYKGQRVELIAGPLCGDNVVWSSQEAIDGFRYIRDGYEYWAAYEYEGKGKAVWVEG